MRTALHAGEDPLSVGAAYESLLSDVSGWGEGELEIKPATARKRRGAYFTPRWLVHLTLDLALEPLLKDRTERELRALRVLDPACGSGVFLAAAMERVARRLAKAKPGGGKDHAYRSALRYVVSRCAFGMDRDPVAVDICRAALRALAGGRDLPKGLDAHIIEADGLLDDAPQSPFDVVVGNPPYLNRLERATTVDRSTAVRLQRRFGAAARAYTDVSSLFLLRSIELSREGGRVALVLPQSVLGSRDAAGVRASVATRARMTDVWLADGHVFDASVFVCVPVFHVGRRRQGPVRRWIGVERSHAPSEHRALDSSSWAPLAAVGVPEFDVEHGATIGDVAEVAADFRDEYYGLVGLVEERTPEHARHISPLVTTGLIGIGECLWGREPCRFGGRVWVAPCVDVLRLARESTLGPWASSRRRPKVLLATQTKVLEAAVDARGEWLPVTPLISIIPRRERDLWRLGAALCSPVASAIAARLSGGTGLTRGAIKLSATQVRGLPMPRGDLGPAVRWFKKAAASSATTRGRWLVRAAEATCAAYGMESRLTDELMDWWKQRARIETERPVQALSGAS